MRATSPNRGSASISCQQSKARDSCANFLKIERWSHHLWGGKKSPMSEFLTYVLVPIAIIAVAIVLLLGLANMMRGGSPHTSQKLMRLRVLLQFIAIIVIMITIWAIRG
jgi:hypothetical protein